MESVVNMAGTISRVMIIAVGDELLEGKTVDTNSSHIQRALGSHTITTAGIQVVPDALEAIDQALQRTEPGDLVFLTGGLGSTPDDLTRDAVARWAGVSLDHDSDLQHQLEQRWIKRGIKARPGVNRQSQIPQGLTPLENPVGSAPGLVGTLQRRTLVLLPGVPQEMKGLLPLALDWLTEQGLLPEARPARLWRTAQIAELTLVKHLAPVQEKYPELVWSWWLTDWGVDVRIALPAGEESGLGVLDNAAGEIDDLLGHLVYSRKPLTLPQVIQERMLAAGQTLAVAESCTAGMLGARFTDEAGSSGFFRGGFLVYADEVKRDQLGVSEDILKQHGAVSEQVVRAMASGCREKMGTDFALAVSGISGPGGGSEEKPVGTTWIAVAGPGGVHAGRYRFPANRERNRLLTVAAAADTLRRVLEFGSDRSPWYPTDTWGQPEKWK
jgi:nicotinamide-nucleotide amidase